MAPRRFSSRELTLALAAALVIGASVLLMKVMAPLWDQLVQVRQRASVSQEKLDRWRSLVARRSSIEQAYARSARFRTQETPERVQAILLGELEELARTSNVQMALKPRPIQTGEQADQVGLEVQLDGAPAAVLGFLDRLLAWPRLMVFERIRISTVVSAEQPLRANIILGVFVPHPVENRPGSEETKS